MGLEHMEIDIPLPQRIITCTIEGIVEAEDLRALYEARAQVEVPMGLQAGDISKIREKHHVVARYVASGMELSLVATLTNYTAPYLSTLLNNPSMQELVAHYRANHINAATAVADRLRHVALKAVDGLEDKLAAEELDANELLAVAKLGLDRSGHGPQNKTLNVTESHLIDHAELLRLNRAAKADSLGDIINITPSLPSPTAEPQ